MRVWVTRGGGLGVAALAIGCVGEPAAPAARTAPIVGAAVVTASAHTVLGAVLAVRVRGADSVAVRFRLDDLPIGEDSVTPAVSWVADSTTVPVLGLLPGRRYTLHAVAYWPGGAVSGPGVPFQTGELPADLPRFAASGSDPSPGYVVFATGRYGVVIDNTGRVVWYRRFPDGPGLTFMAQPDGRYAARPTTPDTTDVEPWLVLDPAGEVTRTVACAGGLRARVHDLLVEADGSSWLLCDETRTVDLSASGGASDARVTGTAVQRVSATGALLFHWSPFDHLAITDLDSADRAGSSVNWTHGNALDRDREGNLLVSFRNLHEVIKIDARTGAVLWRLGGRRNQFTFLDASAPAFLRQHSVRVTAPGTLILLDNVGQGDESRAERYTLDETQRTARLVQSYGSTPAVLTQIGGSVQPLPHGRTLVSFGTAGRVEEYDSTGQVVWRIDGNPGYIFRAQRIRSLYAPGRDSGR